MDSFSIPSCSSLRKCVLRLLFTATCGSIGLSFYVYATGRDFKFWTAMLFFVFCVMALVNFLVFILTEINAEYVQRELSRAERESGFNRSKDKLNGANWNACMALRREVLLKADKRVTFLCYAVCWLNPFILFHCHRLVLDWRWVLKDWRGVRQSIKWTRIMTGKGSDHRISACHVVWDYWKNGKLPAFEDFLTQYFLCAMWHREGASLPFLLAALILLKNNDKAEALKILTEANKTLKLSALTDYIFEIRKNRWMKSKIALPWDFYYLDFGNCLQLALKEQQTKS